MEKSRKLWNDDWSFLRLPLDTTLSDALARRSEFKAVDIPHDWLIYDSLKLYEDGMGWYVKKFDWDRTDKRAFVTFEGVYMDTTVYVNGNVAGEWKYGYSTFSFDITKWLVQGENEIAVSVRYQSPNSRWYSGAGIYRDVYFEVTEAEAYFEHRDIYISSRCEADGSCMLHCEVTVKTQDGTVPANLSVVNELCGAALYGKKEKEELPHMELLGSKLEGNVFACDYKLEGYKCWDTQCPQLYCMSTKLLRGGELLQEDETAFGIRKLEFSPEHGFLLNGRQLKINGVCEHHDLGALGAAFNSTAMRRKLKKLIAMGVNAVRTSHNMVSPKLLALCDEMGVMVVSEAFDMWERPKTTYDYARFFKEWHERDVESWVKNDRNHPCVIMWSIGNEVYDMHADARGLEVTKELTALVHRFDPYENAHVTAGSNWMPWENAQKCADVYKLAGYNYAEKFYKEHHEKHPDWVIYGSETSSIVYSRGVYHFPLDTPVLADDDEQCSALGNSSTSWGAKSFEAGVTLDRDMEFSMGQFLWSGFDYIGEPTPYHTKNSYFGQLDTAGFEKDAYYVWQSAWTDYKKAPMVHVFPYWDFNEGQKIDVRVCSNCPEVELFVNGRSLGRQSLDHAAGSGSHIIADYQVMYEKGAIEAVAYDTDGTVLARQERKSFSDACALTLRAEATDHLDAGGKPVLYGNGRDMLFVEIGAVDADGNPVENACNRVEVKVSGGAALVGLDNGDSTDFDSYKGLSRRLFNGKLLAMLRAKCIEGDGEENAVLEVSSNGLVSAKYEFKVCGMGAVATDNLTDFYTGQGLTAGDENVKRQIALGKENELPVRRIELIAPGARALTPDNNSIVVEAKLYPEAADDREVSFAVVNSHGVPLNFVCAVQNGSSVTLSAKGDGDFLLRCMSKSGTDKIRLISQLEFKADGFGAACLDPYDYVYGSQYTKSNGNESSGNERGFASARGADTIVAFESVDFGDSGADEITIDVFALDAEPYIIEVWEGYAGSEGAVKIDELTYQKPSKWNVYQPDTWKLKRALKGITTICFVLHNKVHIRGFSFAKREKAYIRLNASEADSIYGDSFRIGEGVVEEIGNNVSLVFRDMDFGDAGTKELVICGRAAKNANTIRLQISSDALQTNQILEFECDEQYKEKHFTLEKTSGKCEVTFVFLPGSCFDFKWFEFKPCEL